MERKSFFRSLIALLPLTTIRQITYASRRQNSKGFKVASGDARFGHHFRMKGVTLNTLTLKISGKDTHDAMAVFVQTGLTPNGGPPLHIHPHQDEWFFILEGEYLFQVGEDRHRMKAGDTIFLPKAVPHGFIQLTEKASAIVTYQPAGKMEAFFAATDKWNKPPSPRQVGEVFAAHDMTVVGPPLNPPTD